jgi:rRNA maturation endonuclease Nob1
MTAIVCDACKKAVPGARKDVNYMVVLDRELCETCGDQLLNVTKVQMKSRKPYTFKDYNDILVKNLNQLTGR